MESDPRKYECKRCGICCATCTCGVGKELPYSDACKFVSFDKDGKATCEQFMAGKVSFKDIGGGGGCVFQHLEKLAPTGFAMYVEKRDWLRKQLEREKR